jgi:hypothetical protein
VKFSDLATPPVTTAEAERADHSICPYHGGKPGTWWQEGRVYFCPIGKSFWRYGERRNGMYAPLLYGNSGIL